MTQVSSLYLHVPFCQHLCNYCDFYKRKLENHAHQFEEFHQFLILSLRKQHEFFQLQGFTWSDLETLYLGGGTPSLWGPMGAKFLNEHLPIPLKNDCEFTMEIDPGTWTEEMLSAWKEIGLNRISIGTQTLNTNFLKIMDRVHSLDDSLQFLERLQKDDWNFSLDFLLGIPFSQTQKRNIQEELDLLLKYRPKHISLYILNARSKYPHTQSLPDDEYIREEYLFVSEYLKSHGFHHYEVSNFALPGFESKHNQKYWQSQSVAALGPTGTGFLKQNDRNGIRYKWKVSSADFEIEKLGEEELGIEELYLKLRTSEGVLPNPSAAPVYQEWQKKGYCFEEQGRIKLSSLGFIMLDSLMDDWFRWEASHKKAKV